MSDCKENVGNTKIQIMEQTADLSRLLGMVPSDETIEFQDPLTHDSMPLSDWLSETRDVFLSLSTSIGKALDIQLQ